MKHKKKKTADKQLEQKIKQLEERVDEANQVIAGNYDLLCSLSREMLELKIGNFNSYYSTAPYDSPLNDDPYTDISSR